MTNKNKTNDWANDSIWYLTKEKVRVTSKHGEMLRVINNWTNAK